jgi:hypothetical protein
MSVEPRAMKAAAVAMDFIGIFMVVIFIDFVPCAPTTQRRW